MEDVHVMRQKRWTAVIDDGAEGLLEQRHVEWGVDVRHAFLASPAFSAGYFWLAASITRICVFGHLIAVAVAVGHRHVFHRVSTAFVDAKFRKRKPTRKHIRLAVSAALQKPRKNKEVAQKRRVSRVRLTVRCASRAVVVSSIPSSLISLLVVSVPASDNDSIRNNSLTVRRAFGRSDFKYKN
ncbi:unnamed protein product [Soboliphyme baturini]|uniref:Transmembrane protein n=1 Tax=Soboliphyme baturini TaxID=241478 RepID=A0A183IC74_9BILA|nr:unnamed protein product [Soboliphyme baturini]